MPARGAVRDAGERRGQASRTAGADAAGAASFSRLRLPSPQRAGEAARAPLRQNATVPRCSRGPATSNERRQWRRRCRTVDYSRFLLSSALADECGHSSSWAGQLALDDLILAHRHRPTPPVLGASGFHVSSGDPLVVALVDVPDRGRVTRGRA